MADGTVEAAFFGNGTGEETGVYGGDAHIEESSDEYDPSAQSFPDSSYAPPDTTVPAADDSAPVLTSTLAVSSAAPTPVNSNPVQVPLETDPTSVPATPADAMKAAASPVPSAVAALPQARLPHDRIGILEDRIGDDERGDLRAWLELVEEYRKRGKLDDVRKVYNHFFAVFPLAGEEYIRFADMESEAGNRKSVEAIYNRSLKKAHKLGLWTHYLNHIRRYFSLVVGGPANASMTVQLAYEAAIETVGFDHESGQIWQDYVAFFKTAPGIVGGTGWQDSQKMDRLRVAYQRAIVVPHSEVEAIWREYNAFENSVSKINARKNLQEKSPNYMTARGVLTELRGLTAGLTRTSLPRLPPAPGFNGYEEYMHQVVLWNRWIEYEKNDPLVVKQEDAVYWKKRVVFVYKQALMTLYFWPQMWLDAAEFCFENELEEEGNSFLTEGIAANPESTLLAFRQADRLELSTTNGNDEESKMARGLKVRQPYDRCLDALYALVDKTQATEKTQIAHIEAEAASNGVTMTAPAQDEDSEDKTEDSKVNEARRRRQARIDAVRAFAQTRNDQLYKTITYVWITMMRVFQRMQGKGMPNQKVQGSRGIFADARKRGRLTSELYSAAALLEYHSGEKDPGSRIFERGTKLFPKDAGFALEYIKFLVLLNDTTNARVVFETTVSRLLNDDGPQSKLKAKPLFAYFRKVEAKYGELAQVMKLEDRMRVAYPDDPQLWSFSSRFAETDALNPFDVTAAQQIISPATQAKPRSISTIQAPSDNAKMSSAIPPLPHVSPPIAIANPILAVSSPKRSLPDEFTETASAPPNKVPRGESPLKGAAGRRMAAQANAMSGTPLIAHSTPLPHLNGPPAPPQLPSAVNYLLSIIPPASTYNSTRFSADAMVRLIQGLHVPATVEELRSLQAARAQQSGAGTQQQGQQYWQQR